MFNAEFICPLGEGPILWITQHCLWRWLSTMQKASLCPEGGVSFGTQKREQVPYPQSWSFGCCYWSWPPLSKVQLLQRSLAQWPFSWSTSVAARSHSPPACPLGRVGGGISPLGSSSSGSISSFLWNSLHRPQNGSLPLFLWSLGWHGMKPLQGPYHKCQLSSWGPSEEKESDAT